MQNTQNTQNQKTQNQLANENDTHSYKPVGGFLPVLNKQGKVTTVAQKRAGLLNALDSKGIQALAINGKGSMSKSAAAALQVDSLESLLASPVKLDGGQVAALRAFLVGSYGESYFNRETMRGLSGMVEYLDAVSKKLDLDVVLAETATKQSRVMAKLAGVRAEQAQVQRLVELRDADIALNAAAAESPAASTKPARA